MKQIFVLSKQDLELSKQEVLRLYKPETYEEHDNILVFEAYDDYKDRLAYTNEVYEYLFETNDLEKDFESFDWEKVYDENFKMEADGLDVKSLAQFIWSQVEHPKVDLKNAKTVIKVFSSNDKFIVGKLLTKTKKDYTNRKAHNRASQHPTSLDPRLARACINLTGKTKGKLLDPFCGSGGLLIEAGLLGYDIFGYDIDEKMLRMCQINLEDAGLEVYDLTIADATKIKGIYDVIITDLPYGRNSKVNDKLINTYKKFLDSAYNTTNVAVVMFPDFVDTQNILGKWKKSLEFNHYLHKSLTKKILVLEK